MKKVEEIIIEKAKEIMEKQKSVDYNSTLYIMYQNEFQLLMDVLNEYLGK